MKTSAVVTAALALILMVAVSPITAFAGNTVPPIVPEPSAILIWAGIAVAGGLVYWWRSRNKK